MEEKYYSETQIKELFNKFFNGGWEESVNDLYGFHQDSFNKWLQDNLKSL